MTTRRAHGRTTPLLRRGWLATVVLAVTSTLAVIMLAMAASADTSTTRAGELEVIAVDDGESARIMFAAPPRLATRTLTDADLDVAVDGQPQSESLRRLSANDIDIAIVVDTSLDADALRTLQGAVVELALELPQGASLTIIDAQGNASPPAPVPGPAIAAIRSLRPDTPDDIDAAVAQATTTLDASQRDRTALLVLGRNLDARLAPIDNRPFESLSYLISVGDGDPADLLGPRAAGSAIAIDELGGMLGATDDVSAQLRSLYLVEIPVSDPSASTATLALSTDEGSTPPTTVALDANALRPTLVGPATDPRPEADGQPEADAPAPSNVDSTDGSNTVDGLAAWVPWLLLAGLVLAVTVALAWLLARRRGGSAAWTALGGVSAIPAPVASDSTTDERAGPEADAPAPVASAASMPDQPLSPVRPPRRRSTARPQRRQRPIAKLAPQTREALARAHLGLRQLALASRETTAMLPDEMFRLSEARASAALDGYDRPLRAVMLDMLAADPDETTTVVRRAAEALSTGWQHTSRRSSAPPAVVEINAVLHGDDGGDRDRRSGRPTAPVRALNPLVEIGLEHMVLAAEPDTHAGLVARAVTAVDIMRAARLAQPVLTLSPHLLGAAERYRAACAADPADAAERDDWLQLLCDAIARRSYVSVEQLHRLRRIRARYRDAAPSLAAARLIDVLLARPVLDVRLIAARMSLDADRAAAVAATAQRVGWLTPHSEDAQAWVANEVVDIFASATDAAHQPA